ncbi:MAG: adenosylcobinamide-GDP ribazoletransferase [Nitrospira sp.]|nr:adenosylcobinamide-GDP ribazoletransferase [Nitrospira sp.]
MRRFLLAVQFLTIIPFRDMGEVSDEEIGKTTSIFPAVGFVEGLILAMSAALLLKLFPAELVNALLVLVLVAGNGGLHMDGLSDTFDALASRGDMEKKYAIMKDSTVGPFGVMAIVMALLLKYACLNAVYQNASGSGYFAVVFLLPVAARWTMSAAALYGRSAKKEGLGRLFLNNTEPADLMTATIITLISFIIIPMFTGTLSSMFYFIMVSLPLLFGFTLLAVKFFKRHFEGMNGDSLGAVYEIASIVFLMTAAVS